MKKHRLGLKAATITPEGKGGIGSPNQILRKAVDGNVIVRINAMYGRRDGTAVTLPAVTIFSESEGLIDSYQVFVDIAPVVAP